MQGEKAFRMKNIGRGRGKGRGIERQIEVKV